MKQSNLTPGQSSYIVSRMLSERKINKKDIEEYLSQMRNEIEDLQTRLTQLREAQGESAEAAQEAATPAAPAKRRRRRGGRAAGRAAASGESMAAAPARKRGRKPAAGRVSKKAAKTSSGLTAAQQESRQLQGLYMSLIRQVPKNKRSRFKAVAKNEGRQAAVDQMKATLGK